MYITSTIYVSIMGGENIKMMSVRWKSVCKYNLWHFFRIFQQEKQVHCMVDIWDQYFQVPVSHEEKRSKKHLRYLLYIDKVWRSLICVFYPTLCNKTLPQTCELSPVYEWSYVIWTFDPAYRLVYDAVICGCSDEYVIVNLGGKILETSISRLQLLSVLLP